MKTLFLISVILLSGALQTLIAFNPPDESQRRSHIIFLKEEPKPKWMLGGAAGFPTGISAMTAWYSEPFAVRLSSGFGQIGWQGFQTDVAYQVFQYGKSRHDVSLTGGVFKYEDVLSDGSTLFANQTYIGSTYSVLYKGFHIQLGFAYGIQDYSHYILLFQAGYMFKLL